MPVGAEPRNPAKAADVWVKLASVLEASYGADYQPAADYLRALARGTIGNDQELADLPWHANAGAVDPLPSAYEPHPSVLAAISPSVPLRAIWRRLPGRLRAAAWLHSVQGHRLGTDACCTVGKRAGREPV